MGCNGFRLGADKPQGRGAVGFHIADVRLALAHEGACCIQESYTDLARPHVDANAVADSVCVNHPVRSFNREKGGSPRPPPL